MGASGVGERVNDLRYKDTELDQLADSVNTAQFVSFDPGLRQRHSRVVGQSANFEFGDPAMAVATLLRSSSDDAVNVRSYLPWSPEGGEFIYGLQSVEQVLTELRRLGDKGFFTIVNETIDVMDGGVSGVIFGDVVEFAPESTPRCVDKPGTAIFPRRLGLRVLQTIYGFRPELSFPATTRVEFSLHPIRRGLRKTNTIIWESSGYPKAPLRVPIRWPNLFSRFIGDKAFGLLIAHSVGLPVPMTRVISRKVAPFDFGRPTKSGESWLRTAPPEPVPGKFTTLKGWTDPFSLLNTEDPGGGDISSVLCQDSVAASYSGAAAITESGELLIESVLGHGDAFMTGVTSPLMGPGEVEREVKRLMTQVTTKLGPGRTEWAYDGKRAWVLQVHSGAIPSDGDVIVPGKPSRWEYFATNRGLDELRRLVDKITDQDIGVVLLGDVGLMSHMGDVLRRARIPSRLSRNVDPT